MASYRQFTCQSCAGPRIGHKNINLSINFKRERYSRFIFARAPLQAAELSVISGWGNFGLSAALSLASVAIISHPSPSYARYVPRISEKNRSKLAYTHFTHFVCGVYSEAATVPLRRAVVEDMLVQRFTEKMRSLSDEEVAALLERLLSTESQFPQELLQSPAPRIVMGQPPPNPLSKPAQDGEEAQEEEDMTGALIERIQYAPPAPAEEGNSQAAEGRAVLAPQGDAFPALTVLFGSRAAKLILTIAFTGISGAISLIALSRRSADDEAGGGLDATAPAAPQQPTRRDIESPVVKEGKGDKDKNVWGWRWIYSFFKQDSSVPVPSSSEGAQSKASEAAGASFSRSAGVSPASPAHVQAANGNENVLWRRRNPDHATFLSEPGNSSQQYPGRSLPRASGGILWQRRGNEDDSYSREMADRRDNQLVQRDLWRMPMDELRGIGGVPTAGGNGKTPRVTGSLVGGLDDESVQAKERQEDVINSQGVHRSTDAPSMTASTLGRRVMHPLGSDRIGLRSGGRLRSGSLLDNAEPAAGFGGDADRG